MRITKKEFANELAEIKGTNQKLELRDIDIFFDLLGQHLENGNEVQFLGEGTFEAKKRKQKMGRSFKTGEMYELPERTLVKFRPGKKLAERVRINDK